MTTTTSTHRKPSERSMAFLTDLVRDREVISGVDSTESLKRLASWVARSPRSQKEVSDLIDRALKAPHRKVPAGAAAAAPAIPFPAIPEAVANSKYAIRTRPFPALPEHLSRNEYLFVEVRQLRKTRRIARLIGSPGDFNRLALDAETAGWLLEHLSDPQKAFEAAVLFGEVHQCCGKCGAELTDDQSRERKIGPICWKQMSRWIS